MPVLNYYLYPQHSKAVCSLDGNHGYYNHGYQVTVVTMDCCCHTFLVELDLAPSFEWVFKVFRMDIFIRGPFF